MQTALIKGQRDNLGKEIHGYSFKSHFQCLQRVPRWRPDVTLACYHSQVFHKVNEKLQFSASTR